MRTPMNMTLRRTWRAAPGSRIDVDRPSGRSTSISGPALLEAAPASGAAVASHAGWSIGRGGAR
jgi:hypothetical protein